MAKSGTEADIRKWVEGTKPYDWNTYCAGLTMSICRHFGYAPAVGAGGAYSTATEAYRAAKIESKDASKAPRGAIHYWSYTNTIRGVRKNYGHVVVDIRGGGTHVLSATRNAYPMWGVGAGLISVARQTQLIGSMGKYLGWSKTYGKNYFVDIVTAGSGAGTGGTKPLPDPKPTPKPEPIPQEDNEMITYTRAVNDKDVWAVNEVTGQRRYTTKQVWAVVGDRAKKEGRYVPDVLSLSELRKIPLAK